MSQQNIIVPRWGNYNPNFYYLTRKDVDHSILLQNENEKIIITNKMNYELCLREFKKYNVEIMNIKELREFIKKGKEKYIIDGSIPTNLYMQLKNKNLKVGYSEFKKMREIKNKKEIEKIQKAVKISEKLIEGIKVENRTEMQIKNELLSKTFEMDLEKAFEPIVANSYNARFPHYNEYTSKINDYCLIDYGIEFEKYKSDLSRCKGKLGEHKKTYETLQNVVEQISDMGCAGLKIKDFVENVEKLIEKNKLSKFQHGIGHGLGLEVHEYPVLSFNSKDELKENSVITIEPGQYNKSNGLRYENVFLVGKKRLKKL